MLRQALAFVAAVGLVGALAIPAYAVVDDAVAGGQADGGVTASGGAGLDIAEAKLTAAAAPDRDSYTGLPDQPTGEQMAAAYRLAGGNISWPAGDDYPFADGPGDMMSSLRYATRNCTDFVAWRLNRDAGSFGAPWLMDWGYLTPAGGDASNWAAAWESHGWATSTTPVVGSVAWFGYSGNHVAYVQAVNDDGTVTIEEYNWVRLTYGMRTIPTDSIPLYLYPPPRP